MVVGRLNKAAAVVVDGNPQLDWAPNRSVDSKWNLKILHFEVLVVWVDGSYVVVVVVAAERYAEIGDELAAEVELPDVFAAAVVDLKYVVVVVVAAVVVAAAAAAAVAESVVASADVGAFAKSWRAGLAPSLRPNGCPEPTFHLLAVSAGFSPAKIPSKRDDKLNIRQINRNDMT